MKPSMFYIISDTHFDHKNLVKNKIRPENYQDILMDNIEKMVRPQDVLIHLGDITWSSCIDERFVALKCKKILVKGNHDKQSYFWYMNHGFDAAVESLTLKYCNKNILFTHKPVLVLSSLGIDYNVHGHLHDFEGSKTEFSWAYDNNKLHYLIALELNGYKPERLNDIIGVMLKNKE